MNKNGMTYEEYLVSRLFMAGCIEHVCAKIEKDGSCDANYVYAFGVSEVSKKSGKINKLRLQIIESVLHGLLKREGYIWIDLENNVEVYRSAYGFRSWRVEYDFLLQIHTFVSNKLRKETK